MINKTCIVILIAFFNIAAQLSFGIYCSPSLQIPLKNDKWEPVSCFGGSLRCPTGTEKMTINFSVDYGKIHSDILNIDKKMLNLEVSCNYELLKPSDYFSVEALISLLGWAIKEQDLQSIENASIIASWENEYGLAAGAALVFHPWKKINLILPVKAGAIFTSPEYFYLASVGLKLGYQFSVGKKL